MRLRRLVVRDFRNLERVALDLAPAGLALVGENGHGKTNLLEAIYYLQLLRSVRGARDAELVRFGAGAFHVGAEAELPTPGGLRTREAGVGFERAGKRKRVRVDGAEPPRLSDALGAVPSVILSPGDVALVAGAPTERRRYLDVVLALTSRPYLAALQAYRGALVRRNAALRDAARTGRGDARAAVWEPALAEHGAVLWTERRRWVAARADAYAGLCAAIGERAPGRVRYATALALPEDAAGDVAAVRAAIAHGLAEKRAFDLKRGATHVGPHRDDLEIALGGRELRTYGSGGQQRTAAIALRMLEAATLRDAIGGPPLFLLDDPFAELDARRAHRILDLLGEAGLGQAVIAVPRAGDIPDEFTGLERATVRDGVVGR
ncbi:DNA replication and repair protein RecF [Gemmatimonadetes bacterium T265]|nr:DNA replication and repair protein RecF [Gemmatimonadetes bacterium T265]